MSDSLSRCISLGDFWLGTYRNHEQMYGESHACFSYFWGILADKKGRRLTIILSGSGVSIFTIAFGFTNTQTGLVWAIAFRMLAGASNGNSKVETMN